MASPDKLIAAATLSLALAACAAVPTDPVERAAYDEANDPLEPLNREIFDFNLFLDRNFFKPVAQAYVDVVPEFGRKGIRNALNNIGEPLVFANNVLQGEFARAGKTVVRFMGNTMIGVGGLVDVATGAGVEKQTGDFGQTLFAWGAPEGPYLMLPILGPSNPRDGIGMGVDSVMSPYQYILDTGPSNWFGYSTYIVDGIDKRAQVLDELDRIERTSIDFYAQIRSLSRQKRREDLYHGNPPAPQLEEDLYTDPALKGK
jgi:phospholipid-binding lipoprotein MlaA